MSKIDSVFALSGQMIQRGILGSGETQVLDKHLDQLIVLDTCGLDLINFKPNADTLIRVVKRARREVWKYFDMDAKIPPGDRDKADEAATEGRKLRGEPCKVKS